MNNQPSRGKGSVHADGVIQTAVLRHELISAALEFAKAESEGRNSFFARTALLNAASAYQERKTKPILRAALTVPGAQ